jgi:hypothetical protein
MSFLMSFQGHFRLKIVDWRKADGGERFVACELPLTVDCEVGWTSIAV